MSSNVDILHPTCPSLGKVNFGLGKVNFGLGKVNFGLDKVTSRSVTCEPRNHVSLLKIVFFNTF